jgi:hypothetical protein
MPRKINSIGFTGTQQGMTENQKLAVEHILRVRKEKDIVEFHHGDCIGSDAEAAEIAYWLNYYIISHPPIENSKREFSKFSDEELEAEEYLDRNHKIVNVSELMIATPKELSEVLRSGTWATIRYAKKFNKPLIIVFPNGERLEYNQ